MTDPPGDPPGDDGLLAAIAAIRALMADDTEAFRILTGPGTPELACGLYALAAGYTLAISSRLGIPYGDYLDTLARRLIMETLPG